MKAANIKISAWVIVTYSQGEILVCISGEIMTLYPCVSGSSRWILVNERKNWSAAQSHCRQSYTDLASVRNLAENEEIRGLISYHSWIGLFRDGWKWSDGSAMSFSKWDDNHPDRGYARCVASNQGKWRDYPCSNRFYFACYSK
uniref:C-type lectin domain-containing protein n=1 Tax=Myripristis murdjan TaxID=586833 RepID=A0A667X1K7_9TELE